MKHRAIYLISAVVTAVTLLAGAPSSASADDALTGSWRIKVRPSDGGVIGNLATMTAGGGVVNTDPSFATGHGAWVGTDVAGEFIVEFTHLVTTDEGLPPGTTRLTVRAVVESDDSGRRLSGPFVTTFENWAGDELASFGGTVELNRIEID